MATTIYNFSDSAAYKENKSNRNAALSIDTKKSNSLRYLSRIRKTRRNCYYSNCYTRLRWKAYESMKNKKTQRELAIRQRIEELLTDLRGFSKRKLYSMAKQWVEHHYGMKATTMNNTFDQFLEEWKQLTSEAFRKAATLKEELRQQENKTIEEQK